MLISWALSGIKLLKQSFVVFVYHIAPNKNIPVHWFLAAKLSMLIMAHTEKLKHTHRIYWKFFV